MVHMEFHLNNHNTLSSPMNGSTEPASKRLKPTMTTTAEDVRNNVMKIDVCVCVFCAFRCAFMNV
jgi:hypothetical protein